MDSGTARRVSNKSRYDAERATWLLYVMSHHWAQKYGMFDLSAAHLHFDIAARIFRSVKGGEGDALAYVVGERLPLKHGG